MKLRTVLLGATACMLAGQATAQTATTTHRRETVEQRMERMEKIIDQQQNQIQTLKSQIGPSEASAQNTAPEVSSAQFEALQNQVYEQQAATRSAAAVTMKKGRPTIASPDGKYSLSLRTEVMGDYAAYDRSSVVTQAFPGPAATNLQPLRNGFTFRRAQFGVEGKFAGDWGYKLMYEFGGNGGQETGNGASASSGSGARVKEAFITYKGFLDPFTFKIGAAPWPANLSDATSSGDSLFLERPSGATISRGLAADDGRYGMGFFGNGEMWTGSAFLTGDTFGKGALDGQGSVVTRVAIAPIQDAVNNINLHLGGNLSWVFKTQSTGANLAAKAQNISFSDRPELRVTDFRLINTGSISSNSAYTAGLEVGASYGSLQLQGEYFWFGANRRNPALGASDPGFSAWYVEGSYVLTGEVRPYNMAAGAFSRPSPSATFDPANGNWGAWEIAARYSQTDLDYHTSSAVAADRVFGGKQDIYSIGLNFYPHDNVKFMWGWQNVHAKKSLIGTNYSDFYARMQFAL